MSEPKRAVVCDMRDEQGRVWGMTIVYDPPEEFGLKSVKKALIERGWTMTKLARRVGFTREYVSQIVHGRIYRPRAQARIARVLGMAGEVEVKVKVERKGKGEE